MADKAIAIFGLTLALIASAIASGLVRDGARNMDELFHGVPVEQVEGVE